MGESEPDAASTTTVTSALARDLRNASFDFDFASGGEKVSPQTEPSSNASKTNSVDRLESRTD